MHTRATQTQTVKVQNGYVNTRHSNVAQVFNTGGQWVTVARTVSQNSDIEVYDSLHNGLPMSAKHCLAGIVFTPLKELRPQYIDMQ